jgi:very-short-patch-repair endonuclease
MGWEDFMVAAEYDGDQHRTNRKEYVKDIRAFPKLERLGWRVIRVIKEDCDEDIIDRAYRALIARGWDGQLHAPSSL